jgi:hypothetical protein
MAKISQREARSLKKQVAELKAQINRQLISWSDTWPGGTHLTSIEVSASHYHIVKTARLLGRAVVIAPAEFPKLHLYGCSLPK